MNKLIALLLAGAAYCFAQAVVVVFVPAPASEPAELPTGVVYAYAFDEGSGQSLADLSGNANDGQLGATASSEASDPTWSTDSGDAYLDYDGGDRVVAPSTTQTGDFTLAILWHRDIDQSGGELWQSSGLQIVNANTPANTYFIRASTFVTLTAGAPAVPATNTWELTIIRRDAANNWDWCINDGACSQIFAVGPAGNITPTLIGGGGPNADLDGGVAFAAVWDRELSDAEIATLQSYVKALKPGISPY